MKILNVEEAKDIVALRIGRETPLSAQLKSLKVGEALILPNNEWQTESPPYRVANYIAKRQGWKFEQGRMLDGSGWVFKRVG